jgi:hypothetical protein
MRLDGHGLNGAYSSEKNFEQAGSLGAVDGGGEDFGIGGANLLGIKFERMSPGLCVSNSLVTDLVHPGRYHFSGALIVCSTKMLSCGRIEQMSDRLECNQISAA